MALETDEFLTAIATALIAGVDELTAAGVTVWHHGETDPDEDVRNGIAKCKGVSALIYDLGGDAPKDEDFLEATAAVELFVDTTKRNRRKDPELRLASQIRNAAMKALHRLPGLRNTAAFFDCRVKGYTPLTDPDYVAWRITLTHTIYLED